MCSMAKGTQKPTSGTELTHVALNMLTKIDQMASLRRIRVPIPKKWDSHMWGPAICIGKEKITADSDRTGTTR